MLYVYYASGCSLFCNKNLDYQYICSLDAHKVFESTNSFRYLFTPTVATRVKRSSGSVCNSICSLDKMKKAENKIAKLGTVSPSHSQYLVHRLTSGQKVNGERVNVVALSRARLVLGWGPFAGIPSWVFNQSHPGLLRLSIPLWVGTMSTDGGLDHC